MRCEPLVELFSVRVAVLSPPPPQGETHPFHLAGEGMALTSRLRPVSRGWQGCKKLKKLCKSRPSYVLDISFLCLVNKLLRVAGDVHS